MFFKRFLLMIVTAAMVLSPAAFAEAHSFTVKNGKFQLDGKPFQIISGSIHYARVPRAYWRDRLKMAKAMGLNTITTYVFWNEQEPKPGEFDFTGNNDVAEFVREAQQEGLYVILRPGPYVCAEWEFGGFPAWLLKDHSMVVRSSDPKFIAATTDYMNHVGQQLAPLQIGNGGPIIAVQVENEYGSFGDDHAYMEQIHHIDLNAGFTKSLLYTADGAVQLPKGSLPELPAAINFGPGDAQKSFATLKKFRPNGPFMNGEYWDGWFDHWGSKHAVTNTAQQVKDLDWILRQGYSISIYMFEGGTSFGWMNGANSDGKNYQPDVTSYDYDAALNENGQPTPKYYAFRKVIAEDTGITPPPVPKAPQPRALPAFALKQSVSLWKTLPKPVHSENPLSMEDLNQAYGYILYRTELHGPVRGELALNTLHDYAQVYLNGKLLGTLDRRLGTSKLPLRVTAAKARLDILVENTGRVNYTVAIRGERVGILGGVTLADKPLTGWDNYTLPMLWPQYFTYTAAPCTGPCFYRATFNIDKAADTFLDTGALTKGEVWVNGSPLGRFWNIGPEKTLYLPGPWLRQGNNEVVIFDLKAQPGRSLQGLDHSILNAPPTRASAPAASRASTRQ